MSVQQRAAVGGWDPVPDWNEETTMIVRIRRTFDEEGRGTGLTAFEAFEKFRAEHGHIYQNLSDARWWAARVRRR